MTSAPPCCASSLQTITLLQLVLAGVWATAPPQNATASDVTTSVGKGRWYILPDDDLSAIEAFEFALLRINDMREKCHEFQLAPVRRQDYKVTETFAKDMGAYMVYKQHLSPVHHLVPSEVDIHVARLQSVTDLSLYEVTRVEPSACHLYSAVDDAQLMIPWKGEAAQQAEDAAMNLLNNQRKVLCPERPQLQLIRVLAASVQPVEGTLLRLDLEMREASASFADKTFTDEVIVSYALDRNVPGECTTTPEIYPARDPCRMVYDEDEQTALGTNSSETFKDEATSSRRLAALEHLRRLVARDEELERRAAAEPVADDFFYWNLTRPRRLAWDPTSASEAAAAAGSAHNLERPFVEKGITLPDNFDPRLERTICFPRGFSRRQGSCGASWAFASTAAASFRECIHYLQAGDESASLRFFSAQELVSCSAHYGCSGGSAAEAFYYMKLHGLARESCSPYRMRCFNDESSISTSAADSETSTPQSSNAETSRTTCEENPDPWESLCKCLPSVYHLTRTVDCELLPGACPKVKVPHYFKLAGVLEGNTIPQLERHMMQELVSDGPLYVSMFIFEDFFDPVSWTESGIYNHKRGNLLGRHGSTLIGWGTDLDSRDYWLLLNSYGNHWQQEGYFKIPRGATSCKMLDFGAWGADWKPGSDKTRPAIFDVEVSLSPVPINMGPADPLIAKLSNVWLGVAAATDEASRVLVRVRGLSSGTSGETRDAHFGSVDSHPEGGEGGERHSLRIDLLDLGLLGDRLELQLWAVDKAQNSGRWGPVTLEVPSLEVFQKSVSGFLTPQSRRLRMQDGVAAARVVQPEVLV
eukprot:TRINITY_DN52239_c0_g1_i1.p1 TRINITY_DN52239_c0_g1~~TRINITY_DN52239_c0_g1_i1.p1  ORF type:complete len:815 (-),score=164.53 TRINITY_DN52239_c0_g1_i1:65-2509(-)